MVKNDPSASPCPGCNGTGQMAWFGGVSRFHFSYDECPECNGTGFLAPPLEDKDNNLQPEQIAADGTLSLSQGENFLHVLAQILSETLQQGETVHLRGFGSFSVVSSSQPEKRLTFTPGLQLRSTLNDNNK